MHSSRITNKEKIERTDFKQVIADVVRNVYFDLVPTLASNVIIRKNKIIFIENIQDGKIKYIFAGNQIRLLEKIYLKDRKKIWTVHYYQYIKRNGKVYPEGIIFVHHKYKYKIILRLKEIL